MAVDVATIRERIRKLLNAVDGIHAAYKYVPNGLSDNECPCYLVIPGDARHFTEDDLDDQIFDARIETDTGEQSIEFPKNSNEEWLGCEWTLVIEKSRRVSRGP
jgi:hypothetical protein